jgi:flagellar FliL protein
MAKAPAESKSKEGGGGISLVAVIILTLLGAGAGAFFGMQIPGLLQPGSPADAQREAAAQAEKAAAKDADGIQIRQLPPVTTSLANPPNTWIRLELAAIVKEQSPPEVEALVAKLPEDIIAYLRTLTVEELEGPSGYQHLREDLNDRVRIRSKGKVTELIVQALVVE